MSDPNPYDAMNAAAAPLEHSGETDPSSPFSTAGRFGRVSYLAHQVSLVVAVLLVGSVAMSAVLVSAKPSAQASGSDIVAMVLALAVVSPAVALSAIFSIRRLHDMNLSGWFMLLSFVPLVSILLTLALFVAPGTAGPNKFGPPRVTKKSHMYVAFGALPALVFIGIVAAIGIAGFTRYRDRSRAAGQHGAPDAEHAPAATDDSPR